MKAITDVSSEWYWGAFLMLFLASVLVFLGVFICADKRVDGYYLQQQSVSGITYTCVYISAPWDADTVAFCTTDIDKAILSVKELNQTVR